MTLKEQWVGHVARENDRWTLRLDDVKGCAGRPWYRGNRTEIRRRSWERPSSSSEPREAEEVEEV